MVHRRRESIIHRILPLFLLRVHQPVDTCIQNVMIMPTPLSTVCHPSDLHGHRKPSHICERVVYAWSPFFGGRCCWYTSHTHNAFKQEVSFKVCYDSLQKKYWLRFPALLQALLVRVAWLLRGGLLLLLIYLARLMRSKIFPPSRYRLPHVLMTQWSTVTSGHYIIAVMDWSVLSMIDQITSLPCFGVMWHRHNITCYSCAANIHGNDWLLHHHSMAFSIVWSTNTSLPCLVCYGTGITSFFNCLPSWAPSLLCKQLLPSCCLYGGKFTAEESSGGGEPSCARRVLAQDIRPCRNQRSFLWILFIGGVSCR